MVKTTNQMRFQHASTCQGLECDPTLLNVVNRIRRLRESQSTADLLLLKDSHVLQIIIPTYSNPPRLGLRVKS